MRAETMHKMCLGKRIFRTYKKAEKAQKRIAKQGTQMRIYGCPVCLHYHLTKVLPHEQTKLVPPPLEIPKSPQRKWGRHAQWCIDNCLKYPDASLSELKKMARREIAREDLKATIERDIEWKRRIEQLPGNIESD